MAEQATTCLSSSSVLGKRRRQERLPELILHLSGGSRSSVSPVSDYAPSISACESDGVASVTGIQTEHIGSTACGSGKTSSGALVIINGRLVKDIRRRYRCTFEGCEKSYRKPSRLEEHERTHTGEVRTIDSLLCFLLSTLLQRPFSCSTCSKSYFRESHLQAHVRSHLPESARPLACSNHDCTRRFWTTQHLKVHEGLHFGDKPFKVEASCIGSGLCH